MVKEDYIMRLVHEMVRALLKLLFHIDFEKTSTPEFEDAKMAELYQRIKDLSTEGNIDEAENCLWEMMTENNQLEGFKVALLFYDYLNNFDDERLEKAGFCREEVSQGLKSAAKQYGYDALAETLLEDNERGF